MGLGLSGWKVLGASVEGSGHRRDNTGCQDAHSWTVLEPDILIAAVADGAGSVPLAALGSRTAADFAVQYLAWRMSEDAAADGGELLAETVEATRRRLQRAARELGHDLHDLATTLSVVVATPDRVCAIQVGDGAVVVGRPDGSFVSVAAAEQSEYLNETTFLTSKLWSEARVSETVDGPVESIGLLTDGLGLLALDRADGSRPHAPFFAPLVGFVTRGSAEPQQLEKFLGSERVGSRTDDDVTLVLAAIG
ncbi:MAG: protein phosphatase 2C domain-containing protein [Actinobacteria bacterium]|nr:protein phosphatase 2C domain-containing protein [Actinomycetota bacterium]